MNVVEYLKTDLIQAKVLGKDESLSTLKIFYLLITKRICRIQLAIRLRFSSSILSIVAKLYLDLFHIEVGRTTKIGSYFWLPHPRCIIIADDVIIGDHVHVGQYVSIGGNFKKQRSINGSIQKMPMLGSRINIHAGAVIGGPVTIGDDVIVGANAVVTHDVPSNSMVYSHNIQSNKKIRVPPEGGEYEILE